MNARRRLARWYSLLACGGLAVALLALTACDLMQMLGYATYEEVRLTPRVHNLEGLNTPFDDYNAAAPPDPFTTQDVFVYAGNGPSEGEHFDILKGRFVFSQPAPSNQRPDVEPAVLAQSLGPFLPSANGPANEYGPLFLGAPPHEAGGRRTVDFDSWNEPTFGDDDPVPSDDDLLDAGAYVLSSDRDGRLDLFVYDRATRALVPFAANDPEADDAYLTYDYRRGVLYFASNRAGSYDIYAIAAPSADVDLAAWLRDPVLADLVEPVAALSSEADDTCPHVFGDLMLLASNRPGGKGGFDLYYSRFQDGGWTDPVSLSTLLEDVNSAEDDFRPSLHLNHPPHETAGDRPLLLFSSNRPGGKGGFDLYLAVLPPLEW